MEDLALEDDKKHIISREIDRFRDTYKVGIFLCLCSSKQTVVVCCDDDDKNCMYFMYVFDITTGQKTPPFPVTSWLLNLKIILNKFSV